MKCYIFINDSKLWIEGQRLRLQGHKLPAAAAQDPRFRADLGRFMDLIAGERSIVKAFLYGAVPPPNDSVWDVTRKNEYAVQIFKRFGGREKPRGVEVAIASEITAQVYEIKHSTLNTDDVVFITVTGDCDLMPPILQALKQNISVELWLWESSMTHEFRWMANNEKLLTVKKFDDILMSFSYKASRSTRRSTDIDPAHAIVFRNLPDSKAFFHAFADELSCLLHLFYITRVESKVKGKTDLIVEFPNSEPDIVLMQLQRCKLGLEPCSYPEYTMEKKSPVPQSCTSNKFESLYDITKFDDEAMTETIESFINCEIDSINSKIRVSKHVSVVTEKESDVALGGNDRVDVAQRNVRTMTTVQKQKDTRCRWQIHCIKGSSCLYLHTEEELKIFRVNAHINFRYWKTRLCNKLSQHSQVEQQNHCPFAHGDADAWCLKCKSYGHFTKNCAV